MDRTTLDAALLAKMFLAGAKNLDAKKEWINELNVFPVPDGDTGTNMCMTIMSAAKEVNALENPTMESLAKAISSGSLRGARGNSGVILSQLFRGFTKVIATEQKIDKYVLMNAIEKAVETAYKAVMKPKEGTILTVARGAADKAVDLAFNDKYGAKLAFTQTYFADARAIASGFGGFGGIRYANYYVEDGTIKFAQAQQEWYDMMVTLNKWYEMGLIDPDVLSLDNDIIRSKVLNNEVGASFTAMSQITNWTADAEAENTGAVWTGVSYLRTAEGEPTTAIRASYSLNQNFGALITTSCPEDKLIEAIRFLNYGYTEEGHMYWNFGTEGVSYVIGEDGHPQFTEVVTGNANGQNIGVANYSGTSGAGIAIQAADMVRAKNVKVAGDAVDKWIENTVAQEYCVPGLTYDTDTTTELNDLNTAINTRVDEVAAKFMTGEESLDNYEAFIQELNEMGVTRVLEIMQTAYDAQYK